MNTIKLREKLYRIEKVGYGTYKITIEHRRRVGYELGYGYKVKYTYTTHITHNSQAVDRYYDGNHIPDRAISHGYTYKQALIGLIKK